MSIHNYIHPHPLIGFLSSVTLLFSGSAMPYAEIQIPEIVMQLVQLSCWGAGVLIAYMTYRKKGGRAD